MLVAIAPMVSAIRGTPLGASTSVDPTLIALSFVVCALGSLTGLQSARRARHRTGARSVAWLATAALCVGGAAVWAMHLIGLLAYRQAVTYSISPSRTVLTFGVAVAATGAGLYIASRSKGFGRRFLAPGAIMGLGVATVPYLGRYSTRMSATLSLRPWIVVLSVLIAIAAAYLALFFAATVTSAWATATASVVIALGLCAMFYTGMAATTVTPHLDLTGSSSAGVDSLSLALRVFAIASVLLFGLMFVVLFDDDERGEISALPQSG